MAQGWHLDVYVREDRHSALDWSGPIEGLPDLIERMLTRPTITYCVHTPADVTPRELAELEALAEVGFSITTLS